MQLSKKEIEEYNWLGIVVKMDKSGAVTTERDLGDGKKIHMATLAQGEEAGLWVNIRGTVICSNADWLEKGDTAYLHRNAVRDAFGHGDGVDQTIMDEDKNTYILLKRESHVVLAYRGEELICPPNRVLIKPIPKPKHEGLVELIESGSPYLDKVFIVEKANGDLAEHIGKEVLVGSNGGVPIESERNKTLPYPIWWCREEEIVGEYATSL